MTPPMVGSWLVEVRAVRPYAIHGDLYFELHVLRADEPAGSLVVLRIPQHAADGEPAPGQRLRVTFLMGQVTGAKVEL